ncbi:MAG: PQQ-dependent sugar dehydrogenase [Myxococcota bacterium]
MRQGLLFRAALLFGFGCSELQSQTTSPASQSVDPVKAASASDAPAPQTSPQETWVGAPRDISDAVEAAGLRLPVGFDATVFGDLEGKARHIVVRENGDVFVSVLEPNRIVGMRDTNGDGRADLVRAFEGGGGTGLALNGGYLYYSSTTAVFRRKLDAAELLPSNPAETVVSGFPEQRQHAVKTLTFDGEGRLYVNVGAPSNACQKEARTAGSPGLKPCPQLARQAGVWRFPSATGLTQFDGRRVVTGTRNMVALEFNHGNGQLYGVQHGRDQLNTLFPDLYDAGDNAELPSEEFLVLHEGFVGGWPYTYYDHRRKERMVAPEYGGDGETATTEDYPDPIYAFPGHYAPNDLVFYRGAMFPQRFRDGAFIAFHGSWNRAPLPQKGYQVVFVPMSGSEASGRAEVFADGFAGKTPLRSSGEAEHRPTGLAVGPKGALFIADSVEGMVYRITHEG